MDYETKDKSKENYKQVDVKVIKNNDNNETTTDKNSKNQETKKEKIKLDDIDKSAFFKRLTALEKWLRIILSIAFMFILSFILVPLIGILTICQILFLLFTDNKNDQINEISHYLKGYTKQIVAYLLITSDIKPFPFSRFEKD